MKKYLVLPINNNAKEKDICITPNEGSCYGLTARIDANNPNYYVYADITHINGIKYINLSKEEYRIESNKPDCLYKEELRPKIHYTVSTGWNNDPNGMLFCDGTYHMFYQFNPAGNTWGNMHWGHATSNDMIHFKEEDIALFPDHCGAVYSGSAIIDYENVTGLKENDNDPIILFYTGASYRFNQCIAYSVDKGKTFKKYKNNPIIKFVSFWNRDPKVIKCDELKCYIMALYLDGSTYIIYKSTNLLDWEELQRVDIDKDFECPDIFKIKIEETGKYVYVLQGANGFYLTGNIINGKFNFSSKTKKCLYGNYIDYCGQSYSGLKDRVVQVYWQKSIVYPNMPWGSNLSLPQEITMHQDDSGDLRLYCYVTKEFENLPRIKFEDGDGDINFGYDFKARVEVKNNTLIKCFNIEIPIPEEFNNKTINLRLIVDTIGITAYINEGERFTSIAALPDYKSPAIDIMNGNVLYNELYKLESFNK